MPLDVMVLDRLGTRHHLRDAGPDDLPGIQRLLDDLSPRSTYQRFFTEAVRSAPYTASLMDSERTLDAVVATTGGRIVAVGSTHQLDPESAELALAIADDEQGHGLGTLLLETLAARARGHGVTILVGEVLLANGQMLDVLEHLGLAYTTSFEGGVAEVRIDLRDTSEFREAMDRRRREAEANGARSLQP